MYSRFEGCCGSYECAMQVWGGSSEMRKVLCWAEGGVDFRNVLCRGGGYRFEEGAMKGR